MAKEISTKKRRIGRRLLGVAIWTLPASVIILLMVVFVWIFSLPLGYAQEGVEITPRELGPEDILTDREVLQSGSVAVLPQETSSPREQSTPVSLLEYGELRSSMSVIPSTEDYEKYLAEDLCFHEACEKSEDGMEYGDFDICLPQFGKNMPCYRKLNTYFEGLYAQLLSEKENFHARVKEAGWGNSCLWYDDYSYCGMTIGEQYLTVYVVNIGYCGGIRDYIYPMPVTFDLTTGKPVTLQEILGCSEPEIVELVADYVYGYFLSQGVEHAQRNTYLCYSPQDFYMLEQGLGVYYPRYAIDCGAAGDFLFVIPYDDLYARVSAHAFPIPRPSSPPVEPE